MNHTRPHPRTPTPTSSIYFIDTYNLAWLANKKKAFQSKIILFWGKKSNIMKGKKLLYFWKLGHKTNIWINKILQENFFFFFGIYVNHMCQSRDLKDLVRLYKSIIFTNLNNSQSWAPVYFSSRWALFMSCSFADMHKTSHELSLGSFTSVVNPTN